MTDLSPDSVFPKFLIPILRFSIDFSKIFRFDFKSSIGVNLSLKELGSFVLRVSESQFSDSATSEFELSHSNSDGVRYRRHQKSSLSSKGRSPTGTARNDVVSAPNRQIQTRLQVLDPGVLQVWG